MAIQNKVILWLLIALVVVNSVFAAVYLSVSQDINPGDDIRQSVTLRNTMPYAHLKGNFVSDNGWCKWDNGKTVKHVELDPLETRVEVLIIQIPEEMVLDNDVCVITFEGTHVWKTEIYIMGVRVITFEGTHVWKTEIYIMGAIVLVILALIVWAVIRWIRKRRSKKDDNSWMEEALH